MSKRRRSSLTSKPARNYSEINENHLTLIHNQISNLINSQLYIDKTPDIKDYYLKNALYDINFSLTYFLSIVTVILKKQIKSKLEQGIIFDYLYFMKELTNLVKKADSYHFKDYISILANQITYEFLPKNNILCRLGDKGKNAYIILDGAVDILIKQSKKVLISEEDYLFYILTLIKYNEFALLNSILKENYMNFQLILIDDRDIEKKKIGNLQSFELKISSKFLSSKNNKLNSSSIINLDIIEEQNENDNNNNKIKKEQNKAKERKFKLTELFSYFKSRDFDIDNYNLNIQQVSSEEYIQRLEVYKELDPEIEYNFKTVNVTIYKYMNIISKEIGSLVGDVALNDPKALRTATMISSKNCHLGLINKKSYDYSLKFGIEKQRRQRINFILSVDIFNNMSYFNLNKKYYNDFVLENYDKGKKILEQFNDISNIYIIKEGDFDVTSKMSLNDINLTIKQYLAKIEDKNIIKYISENIQNPIRKEISDLKTYFGDKKSYQFLNKIHLIKFCTLSSHEIIGLDDFINPHNNKSYFDCFCSSIKCEVLKISYVFYNQIKAINKGFNLEEKKLLQEKYYKTLKRLIGLREGMIEAFYTSQGKKRGTLLENEIIDEIYKEEMFKIMEYKRRKKFNHEFKFNPNSVNYNNFNNSSNNNNKNNELTFNNNNNNCKDLNNFNKKTINSKLLLLKPNTSSSIERSSKIYHYEKNANSLIKRNKIFKRNILNNLNYNFLTYNKKNDNLFKRNFDNYKLSKENLTLNNKLLDTTINQNKQINNSFNKTFLNSKKNNKLKDSFVNFNDMLWEKINKNQVKKFLSLSLKKTNNSNKFFTIDYMNKKNSQLLSDCIDNFNELNSPKLINNTKDEEKKNEKMKSNKFIKIYLGNNKDKIIIKKQDELRNLQIKTLKNKYNKKI